MNTSDNNPGYPDSQAVINGQLVYNFKEDFVYTQCENSDRENFKKILLENDIKCFVEIGTYGGANLLSLYDIAKSKNIKLYGIDPHETILIYNGKKEEEVLENIKSSYKNIYKENRIKIQNIIQKYKLDDLITYIVDVSQNVVDKFEDNSIDLLHIDGDHSTEGVYSDLNLYYPKVKDGGIIICDDADWESVMRGIRKFCDEKGISVNKNGRKLTIIKHGK